MSEDSEQLYGLPGIERDRGFEPLVPASPVDIPEPDHMSDSELAHFRRPEPAQPEVREYHDQNTGERVPENRTISAEQGAHDLAAIRAAERAEREAQSNRDLASALDQLNAKESDQQPPQQTSEQTDIQPQPEYELSPEETAARAEVDGAWKVADEQISEFLKDPHIRERISNELDAAKAEGYAVAEQARQEVEQTKQAFAQHTAALAAESNALLLAQFPELAARNADELRGKLEMLTQSNPRRAQDFVHLATRAQQIAMVQQQQAQQQAELQQRQSAETFARYAAEQDAKAFAKETPESMAQIRNFLYADAEKAGISRDLLVQTWQSNPALRNAFVSELVADGVKFRMARQGMKSARHNPVQPVMRPGVSSGAPTQESDYSALERSLRGKDLTTKTAADLLIAHRGRR